MTQALLGRGGKAFGRAGRGLGKGVAGTTVAAVLQVTGPSSLPDGVVGVAYTATTMVAANVVGTPVWSATGLPAGLFIDADSGVISGSPTTAGTSNVGITVSDDVGVASRGYANVVVSTSALVILTSGMPAAQIGKAYSAPMAAANGATPYTWSASQGLTGPFPNGGLQIDPASGTITGTPTGSSGNRSITVTVTDSNGVAVSRTYTLAVAPPAVSITTTSLPGAKNGVAYKDSSGNAVTVAKLGGTGPFTWSLVGAPSGLSINSSGVISGTPSDTPSLGYPVKISVSDSAGQSDSVTLNMALAGAASTPPAFAGHRLGIVIPPATGFDVAKLNTLKAAQPDLTIIRNQLDWSAAQPTSAAVAPDFTTSRTAGFRNRLNSGLDSLILVMSPPAWARPAGSGQHRYPTNAQDFGDFCGAAAAYVKSIKPTMRQRWEIWNEPNNAVFVDGVDPMAPATIKKYAQMLQAAYKAIKNVAPDALVATGGPAPTGIEARKSYNWLAAVLDAMKAEYDAGRYTKPDAGWHPWMACDRISHHPYSTGRFANGTVVDSSTPGTFNAFAHDTPLMAQVVVAKVGVEMIFWQTEAGIKHHPNAANNVGWTGGPYTKINPQTGKQENWEVNSESEANAAMTKVLDQWFGRVNWPTGTGLEVWPDVNVRRSTRTELYCYFHMGPDNFTGDFAISVDGMWDFNGVQKRVAGGANDCYEAFTTYVVP